MAIKIRSLFTRQSLNYIDTNRNVQQRVTCLQRKLHRYGEAYLHKPTPEVLEIIWAYSKELLRLKEKYSTHHPFINYGPN